jgi:hypothetical protein
MVRGRIPNDDLHESLSEGEGACSRICDGRSHLPLRGKLGWMTPRPGQKRAGKRNASLGLSFPSEGPFYFPVLSCWDPSTARPVKQDSEKVVRFVGRAFRHDKSCAFFRGFNPWRSRNAISRSLLASSHQLSGDANKPPSQNEPSRIGPESQQQDRTRDGQANGQPINNRRPPKLVTDRRHQCQ